MEVQLVGLESEVVNVSEILHIRALKTPMPGIYAGLEEVPELWGVNITYKKGVTIFVPCSSEKHANEVKVKLYRSMELA